MKTIFLTLIIFFKLFQSAAQDFAPIGSKWYYTEKFASSNDVSYLWIESVGDTVIKGENCRILENSGGVACAFHNEKDYVYSEDSIVYFYVPELDTFQVLYDLKAEKDSSWTLSYVAAGFPNNDTVLVTVDSVSTMEINGKQLKKLHVRYSSLNAGFENSGYSSEIVESIGDVKYLFNLYSFQGAVCDINYSGGLRCYEDSELGFYSTGIANSCTYTGINDENSKVAINIYPNPTTNYIEIKTEKKMELLIEVFDLSGKSILTRKIYPNKKFDVSNLNRGMYFLKIYRSGIEVGNKKIIKY